MSRGRKARRWPIVSAVEPGDAWRRWISVIAVTSLAYSEEISSRHVSSKKLYEMGDVVVNNCTPHRDSTVRLDGIPQRVGPLSTVAGAALLHAVMVGVAERLVGKITPVPVFWSGNLDGVIDQNRRMRDPYRSRVPFW